MFCRHFLSKTASHHFKYNRGENPHHNNGFKTFATTISQIKGNELWEKIWDILIHYWDQFITLKERR